MAREEKLCNLSEVASTDLSTSQYLAVRVGATGLALAGAGEQADGVLQDKPASGDVGSYAAWGRSKVVLGATLAKGAQVTPNAAGKMVAATSGDYILGTLIEGGDADEVGSVLLSRPGRLA